jgi:Ni,Fe-hydrogenase III small subunit
MIYPGLWRALRRGPYSTPLPLSPDSAPGAPESPRRQAAGREPLGRPYARSLAIRHVDAGSSNGCESEILMLASAAYDLTRLGIVFTASPRHADLLLVTGVVTEKMVPYVREAYDAMPEPKRVIAVGGCAAGGGPFAGLPGVRGSLEGVVPVDLRVLGCPPPPRDILAAILVAAGRDLASAPIAAAPRP